MHMWCVSGGVAQRACISIILHYIVTQDSFKINCLFASMKTILLLHGALGSAEELLPLKSKLAEKYTCITLNMPLHGDNSLDMPFSIEVFSDYLITYVKEHNIVKPIVFGYSMGGFTGMYAATKEPDMFEAVITFATKYKWTPELSTLQIAMMDPAKIAVKSPEFVESLLLTHPHIDWKELLVRTGNLLQDLGNKQYLHAKLLGSIKCKVRIGVGDKDKMVSVEESFQISKSIPNAEFFVLPSTPHPLNKVNSAWLAAMCEM